MAWSCAAWASGPAAAARAVAASVSAVLSACRRARWAWGTALAPSARPSCRSVSAAVRPATFSCSVRMACGDLLLLGEDGLVLRGLGQRSGCRRTGRGRVGLGGDLRLPECELALGHGDRLVGEQLLLLG